MKKYQKFWNWFKTNEEMIQNNIEKDTENIITLINSNLKKVDNELEFEITLEIEKEKRNFIISADGVEEVFDVVMMLCDNAPKLKYWRVVPFRPRLYQKNQVIEMDGISLDYNDIFFAYTVEDEQVDISVFIRDYDGSDNRYIHLYFLLLDSLIGEYDAVKMISNTTIYPLIDEENFEYLEFPKLLEVINEIKNRQLTC